MKFSSWNLPSPIHTLLAGYSILFLDKIADPIERAELVKLIVSFALEHPENREDFEAIHSFIDECGQEIIHKAMLKSELEGPPDVPA